MIASSSFIEICSWLPTYRTMDKINRTKLIYSLLLYGYRFQNIDIRELIPVKNFVGEVRKFHSIDFVEALQKLDKYLHKHHKLLEKYSNIYDDEDEVEEEDEELLELFEEYGLEECLEFKISPLIYLQTLLGASLTAVHCITKENCFVALNWEGGRHHAKKNCASGFCYINDVVLSILELMKQGKSRILCVDVDTHHGDASQEAFYTSDKVFTISLHQFGRGLFPGTGNIDEIGIGKGKYYNLNIPLFEGITDTDYIQIFTHLMQTVVEDYDAEAVVFVVGADALKNDPLGVLHLTQRTMETCTFLLLQFCKRKNAPLLVLGSGGYNAKNTATCFAAVTGVISLNLECSTSESMKLLPDVIPEPAEEIDKYPISIQSDDEDKSSGEAFDYMDYFVDSLTRYLPLSQSSNEKATNSIKQLISNFAESRRKYVQQS